MAGETTQGPCILYQGTRDSRGYGRLPKAVNGSRLAHRAALAAKLGRPVEGVARHHCDNPPCINPDHLAEGTHADNRRDAVERDRGRGGRYNQTHCIHGHELSGENLVLKPNGQCRSGFERICRTCRRGRDLQRHDRQRGMPVKPRRERIFQ